MRTSPLSGRAMPWLRTPVQLPASLLRSRKSNGGGIRVAIRPRKELRWKQQSFGGLAHRRLADYGYHELEWRLAVDAELLQLRPSERCGIVPAGQECWVLPCRSWEVRPREPRR